MPLDAQVVAGRFERATVCLRPETVITKRDQPMVELRGEDWRQIEFVASARLPLVKRDLTRIRGIMAKADHGLYPSQYVRTGIKQPTEGIGLLLDDVAKAMPEGSREYRDNLVLTAESKRGGAVLGGFAFDTPSGARLYGIAHPNV